MGSGQQIMGWIHIQDLVRAMPFLLEHDEYDGIFNGTAPTPSAIASSAKPLQLLCTDRISSSSPHWRCDC